MDFDCVKHLEYDLKLIGRDHRPINSLDGSTFGKICCKKIETGWRTIDGNGQASVHLESGIVRDTGYYMYCMFHDHHGIDYHFP